MKSNINRNRTPLISIIVPVYNVEKYLDKCVKSILNQTYKNLEIILVDDGSTDGSGLMCEEYAKYDERLKVVRKANGGLSDARNSGTRLATGVYLMYIDSDDWVDADTVEFLTNLAIKHSSDIVAVALRKVYDCSNYIPENESSDMAVTLGPVDALNDALYGHQSTLHACGKLYRRSLFEDVEFPKGRLYEDAGTTYKLIAKSEKVTICTIKKYNYLQRQGSIINSGFYPGMMDSLYFAREMLDFAISRQPESIQAAKAYVFLAALSMINAVASSDNPKLYLGQTDDCVAVMKSLRLGVLLDRKAPLITRTYAAIALLGKRSVIMIYRERKRILKSISKQR